MNLKETSATDVQEQLLERLDMLFGKEGYQIVALHHTRLKSRGHFSIVLFHPQGVSLDSCSELHKIADVEIERLQAAGLKASENNDYSLELSSPGLGRRLQTRREFEIFCGQKVRCMIDDQWQYGLLSGLEEDGDKGFCICLVQQEMQQEIRQSAGQKMHAQTEESEGADVLRIPLEQALKVELDS